MINSYTKKELYALKEAINFFEWRNAKPKTCSIKKYPVIQLCTGVLAKNGQVESATVSLKVEDLTVIKEAKCERYTRIEIVKFNDVAEVVDYLNKVKRNDLLGEDQLRVDAYA
ncbi:MULTISPECIES: hypothetical protein [Staphylococcus]|uniref:hypothetical protein n=1 Tax=Staphylococcus TaxID=1279 RepID=UPI0029278260|nr:hypothetical protein [Staphylococcus coagulans]MDU9281705.1 hypothetical protein [Staphylococcus coagulans]